MHLLTFTSWIYPETHFSTTFKTISVYLACKQVELAPVHCELREIHSFHKDAKSTDQQNKFQNYIFNGNPFSKRFIFYRYKDIPSKVVHTKYAVAETRSSGVKLITVIHVLKLLTMFFCIEFQISSSC